MLRGAARHVLVPRGRASSHLPPTTEFLRLPAAASGPATRAQLRGFEPGLNRPPKRADCLRQSARLTREPNYGPHTATTASERHSIREHVQSVGPLLLSVPNHGRPRGRQPPRPSVSCGAEGGIRTPTPLRELEPESSASANSATSAWVAKRRGEPGIRQFLVALSRAALRRVCAQRHVPNAQHFRKPPLVSPTSP